MAGELGDVLLQVAFHSVIAEEAGTFAYADVEQGVVDKLVRRHPHVFGDVTVSDSGQVVANWQAIKTAEHGHRVRRAADRVPAALGALARETAAQKLTVPEAEQGSREHLSRTLDTAPDTAEGVARALAAAVAWARHHGIDPELALRDHTTRALAALPDEAAGP